MAANRINEGSTALITAAFFDEDGTAVTPDSARYRIDDIKTRTAIVAPTTLTGLSTTKVITVTAAQNAIVSAAHSIETRILTLDFGYGGGSTKHGVGEFRFDVINLDFGPVG